MSPSFALSAAQLLQVFPFHFVFNRQHQIVQVGQSLDRLHSQTIVGNQLRDLFSIYRPTINLEFNCICEQTNTLYILDCREIPMQLQGQIVYERQSDVIFFLGSPRITEMAELSALNLTLNDFALHEPISDFLVLLQAQKAALSDARKLTEKLQKQRTKLRETLRQAEQAASAQAQARELKKALEALKLTQTQLIQNEKMASLGQLVAGIAHEINNPVSFIQGNLCHAQSYIDEVFKLLSLYQQHSPHTPPEIKTYIEEIDLTFLREDLPKIFASMKTGTNRIRKIVTSLKNFSRHDEAELKVVNLHDGIDNTLLILQHRLQRKGKEPAIKIIKDYGNLPFVESYAGQLNQVFLNIINNAIDALKEELPHDNRRLLIKTNVSERNTVTISIADNGLGMTQEIQERIFDPFFTTKAVGCGTGLGLSICHQIIVKKHRGSLVCTSKPGQGTEFRITIPIRQTAT